MHLWTGVEAIFSFRHALRLCNARGASQDSFESAPVSGMQWQNSTRVYFGSKTEQGTTKTGSGRTDKTYWRITVTLRGGTADVNALICSTLRRRSLRFCLLHKTTLQSSCVFLLCSTVCFDCLMCDSMTWRTIKQMEKLNKQNISTKNIQHPDHHKATLYRQILHLEKVII